MKTSYFPDNFNPSALWFVAYPNFAPATSYEIVMPTSVPDRVRAEQVFDEVANEVRQRYVCARSVSTEDNKEMETTEHR